MLYITNSDRKNAFFQTRKKANNWVSYAYCGTPLNYRQKEQKYGKDSIIQEKLEKPERMWVK